MDIMAEVSEMSVASGFSKCPTEREQLLEIIQERINMKTTTSCVK